MKGNVQDVHQKSFLDQDILNVLGISTQGVPKFLRYAPPR
jgi:uncharacterized protein YwlG (UPF0340 family)